MKRVISIVSIIAIILQFTLPVYGVNTNSQATPWTREKAEQLARKALFSANPEIVNTLYNAGSANNAVDTLFPSASGPDRTTYNAEINAFKTQTGFSMNSASSAYKYYVYKKIRDPYEAKAKAFVMYEDIFAVNNDGSNITYQDIENTHEMIYNNMFGDYKLLVKNIVYTGVPNSGDYTMGTFLNLFNQQYPNSPNENFARELLQLFLMLEYKPWENQDNTGAIRNYSNSDVASLSRILTGLETNTGTHVTSFNPAKHNTGSFLFLSGALKSGDSFSFYNSASGTVNSNIITTPINGNNGLTDNIVDYIFSKRGNEIADFLAWRLLKYYVKDKPTQAEIESLANVIVTNNFDMLASTKYLLKSDIMYSDEAMNTVYYKNPLELTIGTIKLLHYKNPSIVDPFINDTSLLTNLEWTPYYPGSIFGREGYDANVKFFNAYNHNQWVNYSTKIAYYNGGNYYNLAELIPATRINETSSLMPIITSSGNTYSGSISLSNMNLSLSGGNIGSALSIEGFNAAPEEEVIIASEEVETGETVIGETLNGSGEGVTEIKSDSTGETVQNNEKVIEPSSIQAAGPITFTGIIVSLPSFTITASNNTTITISSGTIDMVGKKLNINNGVLTQSGVAYQITSGTADMSQQSTIERDVNIDETIAQLEDYLYLGRRLPESVKAQIRTFVTTDDSGNSRAYFPNNTSYRNTVLRGVISIMLAQPEFVMNMGYDKSSSNSSGNSLLPNSNSKLVFVELYGGYDWLNAMIQKDNYNDYLTKRGNIAASLGNLIDLGDYYMNQSYQQLRQYYDSNNLRIVNRVGTPNHSRGHDTAAIQVTSELGLETYGTPSIIGKMIENESDGTKNIVLGNNSPNIYSNGNYLNIGGNSSIYTNYGSLTSSGKIAQLNTLKSILNSRTYPGSSSNLFKGSVTIDGVANTSKNAGGQPSSGYNLRQRLDFTKIMIDNNLGTTYYVPGGGGYDTHSDEATSSRNDYDLNNRTADLASDLARFFESVKNKDVTIIVYSEFGRTIRVNGTDGTDHGQGGGYFILSSNQTLLSSLPQKVIGNMNLTKEKYDWLSVGVDYRTIYNKVLASLYNIPTSYLGTQYNLDDYIDTKTPNPILLREEFRPNGNNNLCMDVKFKIEDKNFFLNEASNIEFYYGTNSGNLTRYSDWSIQNYTLQSNGSYKIGSISVPKNTNYYYRLVTRDNQFNEYTVNGVFRTPDNFSNATTTISRNSDNILQRYNNTTINGITNLGTPITLFINSGTGTLGVINGQSGITLEQTSSGQILINSLNSSSGSITWNGGFLLPREINQETLLSDGSIYSGSLMRNLNIKRIIKVGSGIYGVGMRLNNPVRLNIPYSGQINGRLRILTSEDGLSWSDISSTGATFSNGIVSFDTDRFSFFAVVDEATDTVPDAYNFVDQTNLEFNTPIESNTITISGIDGGAQIFVNTGEYLINTGNYTSATGTVRNGDSVKVRLTSATSNVTAKSMTINIGGVTDTWNITTKVVSGGSGGGGGGGGGSSFSRDYCPAGDNSSSYYDGTCGVIQPNTTALTGVTTTTTTTTILNTKVVNTTVESYYNTIKKSINKYNGTAKKIQSVNAYISKIQASLKGETNSTKQKALNDILTRLLALRTELQASKTTSKPNPAPIVAITETKPTNPAQTNPVITTTTNPTYGTISTTAQYVVIRKESSLRAEVIMQINNGAQVEILEVFKSGWVKIKYNGITGYIRKTFLKF